MQPTNILLIINGVAYPILSLTSILLPDLLSVVNRIVFPALLGELWIILWLLIKGARVQPMAAEAGRSLEV